jgi:hypothetical protein
MTVGLVGMALLLRHVGGNEAAWAITAPLLVAGLGGGLVTSPNLTLTLQYVPVRMPAQRAAPCKPPSASARRSAQPYWPRSSTRSSPIAAVTTR